MNVAKPKHRLYACVYQLEHAGTDDGCSLTPMYQGVSMPSNQGQRMPAVTVAASPMYTVLVYVCLGVFVACCIAGLLM